MNRPIMRQLVTIRFLCVVILGCAVSGGCGPIWIVDPPTAERMAKQENKPLLLYFKSWDSSQHRNMRLNVLSNPAVAKEMKDTINTELEFAFFADWRNRYGVRTSQVCVMCAPDGKKVGTPMYVNPVPTPEKFLEWLRATKAEAMPAKAPPAKAPPAKPAPAGTPPK